MSDWAVAPALLPLFRELGDLKRIRSADREGTVAERLFADGWAALAAGAPASDVMERTVGIGTAHRAFDNGQLSDPGLVERVREALSQLPQSINA